MSLTEIDALRPLDPADQDFAPAVEAMRQCWTRIPPNDAVAERFWLIDRDGSEAADIVSLVTLKQLGNVARGTPDWQIRADRLRLVPPGPHAVRDVFELIHARLRTLRTEAAPEYGRTAP